MKKKKKKNFKRGLEFDPSAISISGKLHGLMATLLDGAELMHIDIGATETRANEFAIPSVLVKYAPTTRIGVTAFVGGTQIQSL